jgi:hypothetical protein
MALVRALWESFRQGESMPVDRDEWRKAAEELGHHVRPVIDFLRPQEEGEVAPSPGAPLRSRHPLPQG